MIPLPITSINTQASSWRQACFRGQLTSFDIVVKRNDDITLAELMQAQPDRLIISPGPGHPSDPAYFGICREVIQTLGQHIPLLGVCLGMQGIVEAFGGKIVAAPVPMHGKTSQISHTGEGLFAGVPQGLEVMRYHSLMAQVDQLPACLTMTAHVQSTAVATDVSATSEYNDHGDSASRLSYIWYPVSSRVFCYRRWPRYYG